MGFVVQTFFCPTPSRGAGARSSTRAPGSAHYVELGRELKRMQREEVRDVSAGDSREGQRRQPLRQRPAQYSRRCCQSCFPPCPGLTSPAGQAGPGAGLPRRFPSPCFPGSSCCWHQAASLPGGPVRKTCLDMAGSSGPFSALYSRRGAARLEAGARREHRPRSASLPTAPRSTQGRLKSPALRPRGESGVP